MHSLPSRRRLPQPIFFRSKCYRLAPVPVSRAPAPLPAGAPVPAALPLHAPLLTHALEPPLPVGAVRRQAGGPLPPRPDRDPGAVGQAGALLLGAVRRQGGGTFSQSANRDSLIAAALPPRYSPPRLPKGRKILLVASLHLSSSGADFPNVSVSNVRATRLKLFTLCLTLQRPVTVTDKSTARV